MGKTVLVGMSGGIDSAMTALILQEKGYHVHGIHFNFYAADDELEVEREKINGLAMRLGIIIDFYDAREKFLNDVIGYFTDFYANGLTPSPCVHCNAHTKLKLLSELCLERGFSHYATGHYIQIVNNNGIMEVHKGVDPKKDQSYYMWQVSQALLTNFITPLGDKTKEEIKAYAAELGFSDLVKKKESAGLCFAQGRNIAELLSDYIPNLVKEIGEGKVLDRQGNELGTHKGYIYYTIGQKSNMKLSVEGKPAVVKIIAENNTLVVDHYQSLYVNIFRIRNFNFSNVSEIESVTGVMTKVRGLGLNPEGLTSFRRVGETEVEINLENPAWAPAPGQPAVFYKGDMVYGGGIIC